jgi:hypothetical protein
MRVEVSRGRLVGGHIIKASVRVNMTQKEVSDNVNNTLSDNDKVNVMREEENVRVNKLLEEGKYLTGENHRGKANVTVLGGKTRKLKSRDNLQCKQDSI